MPRPKEPRSSRDTPPVFSSDDETDRQWDLGDLSVTDDDDDDPAPVQPRIILPRDAPALRGRQRRLICLVLMLLVGFVWVLTLVGVAKLHLDRKEPTTITEEEEKDGCAKCEQYYNRKCSYYDNNTCACELGYEEIFETFCYSNRFCREALDKELQYLKGLDCEDESPLDILKKPFMDSLDMRENKTYRLTSVLRLIKLARSTMSRSKVPLQERFENLNKQCRAEIEANLERIGSSAFNEAVQCWDAADYCRLPMYGADSNGAMIIIMPGHERNETFREVLETQISTLELFSALCEQRILDRQVQLEDFHLAEDFRSVPFFVVCLMAQSKIWGEFHQTLREELQELGKPLERNWNVTYNLELKEFETENVFSILTNFSMKFESLRTLESLVALVGSTEAEFKERGLEHRMKEEVEIESDSITLPLWVIAFCYNTGILGNKPMIRRSVALFLLIQRSCGTGSATFLECHFGMINEYCTGRKRCNSPEAYKYLNWFLAKYRSSVSCFVDPPSSYPRECQPVKKNDPPEEKRISESPIGFIWDKLFFG